MKGGIRFVCANREEFKASLELVKNCGLSRVLDEPLIDSKNGVVSYLKRCDSSIECRDSKE